MSLSPFESFLRSLKVHPLIDPLLPSTAFVPLDLSNSNKELKSVNVGSSHDLEIFIWNHIKTNKAKVAYGGYLEQRGIYQRSAYFNQENPETERNIHIGLDVWIQADEPIYAPLDGTLHSFKNNTNYGDYGPTIILKHDILDTAFYTLYGHLSLASIENLKVGKVISQGEQIATLGKAEVNGDYPPHLHFQIIMHIENYKGDYPGVSNLLDLEFYKTNCPNPNLLARLN